MNTLPVRTVQGLKDEIATLKAQEETQKADLHNRLTSPLAIFASAFTMFPGRGAGSIGGQPDYLRLFSRFALPIILNKTIFRGSRLLVKLFAAFVSQKVAGSISRDAAFNFLSKAGRLLRRLRPGNKEWAKHHP